MTAGGCYPKLLSTAHQRGGADRQTTQVKETIMPRIADYITIDETFTLGSGNNNRVFHFDLPEGAATGTRSILAYLVDSLSPGSLTWTVLINGNVVQTTSVRNSQVFGTLHEIVQGNVLLVGENTITFSVDSGSGPINFSEIVLWWQNNI
jgi:hypothetical protein